MKIVTAPVGAASKFQPSGTTVEAGPRHIRALYVFHRPNQATPGGCPSRPRSRASRTPIYADRPAGLLVAAPPAPGGRRARSRATAGGGTRAPRAILPR